MQTIPGGKTGLVVRQVKAVGDTPFYEYAYDTGIVKTVIALQEQAAEEVGQRVTKHLHGVVDFRTMSDEQLAAAASEYGIDANLIEATDAGSGDEDRTLSGPA
jgi:hypothetical protein